MDETQTSIEIQDIYPLAPVQQGMLFHSLYDPDSGVYVLQSSFRLEGALQVEYFQQAWQQVVNRHPILRTDFDWQHTDEPVQIVYQSVDVPWIVHDWQHFSTAEQASQLKQFLEQDRVQGFELDQAPLLRLALFQLSPQTYQCVWTIHHLLIDGWCAGAVLREVFTLYEALIHNYSLSLPTAQPYRVYIQWLLQQDLQAAQRYWQGVLAGFKTPTTLGLGKQRDQAGGSHAHNAIQRRNLSAASSAHLQTMTRQQHLTVNTVIQGAWALLLSTYANSVDVVFGTTVSGRPAALVGVESIIGPFINTLPLRVVVDPNQTVGPWLQSIQSSLLEMREYEYTPLVQIQTWSEPGQGTPLFESIVVFENRPVAQSDPQQAADHRMSIRISDSQAAEMTNYPLTLVVIPGPELGIKLMYDGDRFPEAAMIRLLEHCCLILEQLIADPFQRLGSISLLTQQERSRLVETLNATELPFSATHVAALFAEQVAKTPTATAAVWRNQSLTYAELATRSDQLAAFLLQAGVQPEDRVAVCLERSLELVVGLLGALKAGAAYVPLDPTYPAARLAYMLQDSQAKVLLTQTQLRPDISHADLHTICLDTDWSTQSSSTAASADLQIHSNQAAYVIYTSGSTGKPKGVVVEHCNLVNFFLGMDPLLKPVADGVWLALTSVSFDISVLEIFWSLTRGFKVILQSEHTEELFTQAPTENSVHTQYSVAQQLLQQQVTHLQCTPSLARMLLSEPATAAAFQSLHFLLLGGEALPLALAQELSILVQGSVYNMYGPTETTIWSMSQLLQTLLPQQMRIGGPIANTQIYILDRRGALAPTGVPGELFIGGAGVSRGYFQQAALTADRFVPDPFESHAGARLYRTGDIARYTEDGSVEFLGRRDTQVKLRGHRVEIGELEQILEQHPAVREAAVNIHFHAVDEIRLFGYVVASTVIEEAELFSILRTQVPEFMLPTRILVLDAFPRTPNGKLDRQALPLPTSGMSQTAYVAPRGSVEQELAALWCAILGIEQVGAFDNFFELGGQSILAVRLAARIRSAFQIELPIRTVFEKPVLAQLAAMIADAMTEQTDEETLLQLLDEIEQENR